MSLTTIQAAEILNSKSLSIDLKLFVKKEKIGRGGFSKVYKIQEQKTGQIYAAKMLLKELDENKKKELDDFINEVSFLSKLKHPLLIKLIGISKTNFKNKKKPVIITEYYSKGSLNDIIKKTSNKLTDTKKLIFIYGIAVAMSYIHSKNVLHRDLKTENILSDEQFHPKISDFGLSTQIPDNSIGMTFEKSPICGTPAYIAPEIWKENKYSKASDVYSFAFIVYEIMTNKKPLTELNNAQIIYSVAIKGNRPKINKTIPESYKMLIENCWNQNPANRPSFSDIISFIKEDKGFIMSETDEIELKEFNDYIFKFEQKEDLQLKNEDLLHKIENIKEEIEYKQNEDFKNFINALLGSPISIVAHLSAGSVFSLCSCIVSFANINNEIGTSRYPDKNDKSQIDHEGEINHNKILDEDRKELNESIQSNFLINKLIEEARIGNINSMIKLGEIYYKGEKVLVDKEKAKEYYKKAADLGNTDAMNNYGWILIEENGFGGDISEAKTYLEKAVNRGNMRAMKNYVKLCLELEKIENTSSH